MEAIPVLVTQTSLYLFGKIVAAVVTLLALLIFSRVLTPTEYGLVAWTMSSVMIAFNASMSWLCAAVVRLQPAADNDARFRAAVFALFVLILLALSGALFTTFLFVRDETLVHMVVLGFLLLLTLGWTEINLSFLMAELRAGLYVKLNILRALLSAMFSVLLAYLGWGATGVLVGMSLGWLIPGLWLLATYWGGSGHKSAFIECTSDMTTIRSICSYGLPLAAGYALSGLASNLDRQIVIALEGAAALGLYALGLEVAQKTIGAVMSPIGTAGLPLAVQELERKGTSAAAAQLSSNVVLLVAVGLPSTVGLSILAPEFANLMLGEQFRSAVIQILPVCSCAAFIRGLRSFYVDHAFQLGHQTSKLVIVLSSVAVASLILNLLLIPLFGLIGAAYAALGADVVGLVVGFWLGRRAFVLLLPGKELGKLAFGAGVMAVVVIATGPGDDVIWLALRVASGAAAYAVSCVALNVQGVRHSIALRVMEAGVGNLSKKR